MSQYPVHDYPANPSSLVILKSKALELIFPKKSIFSKYVLYYTHPFGKFRMPPGLRFDGSGYVDSKKENDFNSLRMGLVKSCFNGERDQARQESIKPFSESGKCS